MARKEVYAENAVCTEAAGKAITGLKGMNEKEKNWHGSHQGIRDIRFSNPLINGDFFSIAFTCDLTYKGKEHGGWKEIAVFEVRDRTVVVEKFYY